MNNANNSDIHLIIGVADVIDVNFFGFFKISRKDTLINNIIISIFLLLFTYALGFWIWEKISKYRNMSKMIFYSYTGVEK